MIGPKEDHNLEIGSVAGTRYDDKYKVKIQQHRSFCQILVKERHEMKLYPDVLGKQGSVFNCFSVAMSAVGVQAYNKWHSQGSCMIML